MLGLSSILSPRGDESFGPIVKRQLKFLVSATITAMVLLSLLRELPAIETELWPVTSDFKIIELEHHEGFIEFRLGFMKNREDCRFKGITWFGLPDRAYLVYETEGREAVYPNGRNIGMKIRLYTIGRSEFYAAIQYACPLQPWVSTVVTPAFHSL